MLMVFDLIKKFWPRSLRAGAALVVTLVGTQQALTNMQQMVASGMGGERNAVTTAKFFIYLIVAIVATALFYYFQSRDGENHSERYNPLETLDKYEESRKHEERIKQNKATPAYPAEEQAKTHKDTD
jgi:hypothetical protein